MHPYIFTRPVHVYSVHCIHVHYTFLQAGAPGVYARVTSQMDWIKGEMAGGTCPRN